MLIGRPSLFFVGLSLFFLHLLPGCPIHLWGMGHHELPKDVVEQRTRDRHYYEQYQKMKREEAAAEKKRLKRLEKKREG